MVEGNYKCKTRTQRWTRTRRYDYKFNTKNCDVMENLCTQIWNHWIRTNFKSGFSFIVTETLLSNIWICRGKFRIQKCHFMRNRLFHAVAVIPQINMCHFYTERKMTVVFTLRARWNWFEVPAHYYNTCCIKSHSSTPASRWSAQHEHQTTCQLTWKQL